MSKFGYTAFSFEKKYAQIEADLLMFTSNRIFGFWIILEKRKIILTRKFCFLK